MYYLIDSAITNEEVPCPNCHRMVRVKRHPARIKADCSCGASMEVREVVDSTPSRIPKVSPHRTSLDMTVNGNLVESIQAEVDFTQDPSGGDYDQQMREMYGGLAGFAQQAFCKWNIHADLSVILNRFPQIEWSTRICGLSGDLPEEEYLPILTPSRRLTILENFATNSRMFYGPGKSFIFQTTDAPERKNPRWDEDWRQEGPNLQGRMVVLTTVIADGRSQSTHLVSDGSGLGELILGDAADCAAFLEAQRQVVRSGKRPWWRVWEKG